VPQSDKIVNLFRSREPLKNQAKEDLLKTLDDLKAQVEHDAITAIAMVAINSRQYDHVDMSSIFTGYAGDFDVMKMLGSIETLKMDLYFGECSKEN